jgi:uncharacterized membrane protein YiaA
MRYTLPAVLYFVSIIIVAHFFAPASYVWTKNTISDLASQDHRYKWIMQAGFIGFGLLLTGGLLFKFWKSGNVSYPDLPVIAYGLSVLVTGFFCAVPIDQTLPFSEREEQIHSLFASLAGFFLVIGILWNLLTSPSRWGFHLTFLLLVGLISALFGLSENGIITSEKGIPQRILYLVSFVWLVMA